MQSLASEILAAAKPLQRNASWFDRLDDEQKSVVLDVRRGWQASRNTSGVPAAQVARTMIEKLSSRGYAFPQAKELSRWLNLTE